MENSGIRAGECAIVQTFITSLILLPLLLFSQPSGPRYAAPYGSGDGTPDDPMSLTTALASGGDVWLLPGSYHGAWLIGVNGTTVRSVPGVRAVVDGSLTIRADDVTVQGLEITNTSWLTRTSAYAGSPVPDLPQSGTALDIQGRRGRILHNYIHDLGLEGIGAFSFAFDTEVAYNLIANNGWIGTDRGHGPAIYMQNRYGEKWIHDNVLLPGFNGHTFEIYGSSASFVRNFRLERNIHVGGRYLVGAKSPTDAITATDNLLWNTAMELGYTNKQSGRATATGNYIGMGRIQAAYWKDFSASGNTTINTVTNVLMLIPPITATLTMNAYYRPSPGQAHQPFGIDGQGFFTWSQWQARGYDAGSTFSTALPQNKVFVRSWGAHRGVVTIYNWQQLPSVALDLSVLSLTPGATYHLTNAQNPSERQAFVAGDLAVVPMMGWSVATPIAGAGPLTTFDPRFAVFLVTP